MSRHGRSQAPSHAISRAGRTMRSAAQELVDQMRIKTGETPVGLLQTVRFALQRVRGKPVGQCTHLDQIRDVTPLSTGCQQCLELGDTWVHLRMCMTDGQVGCCDSSKNKHASRHAREHALSTRSFARSSPARIGCGVIPTRHCCKLQARSVRRSRPRPPGMDETHGSTGASSR